MLTTEALVGWITPKNAYFTSDESGAKHRSRSFSFLKLLHLQNNLHTSVFSNK